MSAIAPAASGRPARDGKRIEIKTKTIQKKE
jgi:hypothetical protein